MKPQGSYRMTMVWLGVVAAMALGARERGRAEIIMGEPINVGPAINDATDTQECDFSHDGLELYFSSQRPGGYGRNDIWIARRETLNSPWQEPVNLGPAVNGAAAEVEPAISPDGLELYFRWWDDWNLRVCKRASKDAPWGSPVMVGPPIGYNAWSPDISADGLALYFASSRAGGHGQDDVWVATRATINDRWGEPVNLGPNVNSSAIDWCPTISADGLTLVFGRGATSLWATTRKSIDDDWGPAVKLGFNNPPGGYLYGPALSPDGSTLYFSATSAWGGFGNDDFWQVKFLPVVDFNGDEIVDIADLIILIEHWGDEGLSCDIAPLPLGDGMVNERDLEVLMRYWQQEVPPVSLIAYWKLDEASGALAADSAGDSSGTLVGEPVWQPAGGKLGGALLLDGVDDYVGTKYVLNPAAGPFSVFAWIKGGALGQVILSQRTGANWLTVAVPHGVLATDLKGSGRSDTPLVSQTVIADGDWHRVGLVWDGSRRTLYVDDVAVAEDTKAVSLPASIGAMHIGAGSTLVPGTFWKGLIDDVRIYNRAVKP